jgi:serine/threonine protein kinase
MSNCSAAILKKVTPTKSSDPCPARNKGSFKAANVCEKSPYVFYTPSSSKRGFRESIEDLMLLEKFDKKLRSFFMTAKCVLPNGVLGKTDEKTVVVNKLTNLFEFMQTKPDRLLQIYVDFATRFIKEVGRINKEDIWQVVSTDFKPDNVMIDPKKEQMMITDFSPMRKDVKGLYSYVATPYFIMGDDFKEYSWNKKYTSLQASKIAYHISLVCMMSSLFHLISVRNYMTSGNTIKESENLSFDIMHKMYEKSPSTLAAREKSLMKALRKLSHAPIDMDVVESWLTMDPFKTGQSVIAKARVSKKKSSKKVSPKAGKRSSKPGCSTFLAGLKRSSIKLTNPLTGRQILKKGPDGKPTALVKKIMKHCQ